MWPIRIFNLLLFSVFLAACGTSQPIKNPSNVVPTGANGKMISLERVRVAIVDACAFKRWSPSIVDSETIECRITVRDRHHARIDVTYNQLTYRIDYVYSQGLNEKGGKIHRNYNKWVVLLDQKIQENLNAELIKL